MRRRSRSRSRWSDDGRGVRILDQRELPEREVLSRTADGGRGLRRDPTLAVRGAPAIGIAAAMGVTLALDGTETDRDDVVQAGARRGARALAARGRRR